MNMKDLEILMTLFHRIVTGYQIVIERSQYGQTKAIRVEVRK